MELHYNSDMIQVVNGHTLLILGEEVTVTSHEVDGGPQLHEPITVTRDRNGMQHTLLIYSGLAKHIVRHNGGDGEISYAVMAHDHDGLIWLLRAFSN